MTPADPVDPDARPVEARALLAEARVRQVLVWLARRTYKRPVGTFRGYPLWSVVGQVFAVGCGHANEICAEYGFDPDLRVKGLP